jgi:hypothetical protein
MRRSMAFAKQSGNVAMSPSSSGISNRKLHRALRFPGAAFMRTVEEAGVSGQPEGPPRRGTFARMNVAPRHLFAIHLLTASGAAASLLAVMASFNSDWTTTFVWLGAALFIDGIDGPIARRYRVRERLPKWDGAALDFVIDYTTYVFVPAIVVARALALPPLIGAFCGVVVAVSGAL